MVDKTGEGSDVGYATSFKERLFGAKCEVEVVVDLSTGSATAILSMSQLLASGPAFRISLDDLKMLSKSIKAIHKHAPLLGTLAPEASDHQLNWARGGTSIIVVQPKGKQPHFALSIGQYHREGDLSELNSKEFDEAVAKIEAVRARVTDKIKVLKS
jgi:hypothetical protein